MRMRVFSIIGVLLLLCNLSGFAHTATIGNSGEKQYKGIRLTPEIYQNARTDLADLLLYDENNQPVPYFINRYTQNSSKIQESYDARLMNSFVKDDKFYFEYGVKNKPNQDILATSISVTTQNQNFAKEITLYGSFDNRNWEWIQEDTLYRVEGKEKLDITFNRAQKFPYYRFQLENNLEKISFDSVHFIYNDEIKTKDYFMETIQPQYTTIQEGKNTVIRIEGLKNMEIEEIRMETDSMFQRSVRFAGRHKILYHLMFGNTVYEDMILPLNGYMNTEDVFSITINNGDDKPIQLNGISVTYHAAELVFEGRGNSYTLFFGEDTATPPSYDIVNYRDFILKEGYDIVSINHISLEEKTAEKESNIDYKVVFNIVIVFVALLLGIIMIDQLKKKTEG